MSRSTWRLPRPETGGDSSSRAGTGVTWATITILALYLSISLAARLLDNWGLITVVQRDGLRFALQVPTAVAFFLIVATRLYLPRGALWAAGAIVLAIALRRAVDVLSHVPELDPLAGLEDPAFVRSMIHRAGGALTIFGLVALLSLFVLTLERSRRRLLQEAELLERENRARRRAEEERRRVEEQALQAQKLESLGILAGGVAHDFNNLLTGILGHAGEALETVRAPAEASRHLEKIREAGREAARLARLMLAYSGRGGVRLASLDLSAAVRRIASLLKSAVRRKGALRFALQEDLPPVRGDETQLQQVVMNLVSNAAEASLEEHGSVWVSTGALTASAEYLAGCWPDGELHPGDYVFLEVEDSGLGMEQEVLARAFDPFFTTKFTGRGLGLAAVLGIVRAHHGALRVRSEPGRGTTFRVLLPVDRSAGGSGAKAAEATAAEATEPTEPTEPAEPAEPAEATAAAEPAEATEPTAAEASAPPPPRPPRKEPVRSGTLLVVDDELAVRSVTTAMLERLGFTVLAEASGQRAIDRVRERGDDLRAVLLDLTMPGLDGQETFHRMRRIRADLPVLLMSGYSESDIAHRFADEGFASFLQKPFEAEDLAACVDAVLSAQPSRAP